MDIPHLSIPKIEANDMCFGCGTGNQHGLKLKFRQDAEAATCEFVPTKHHQGWPGYVHGGILIAVLDEAIGWAAHFKNIYAVTAKMQVRLKSMARIGEPLMVSARITSQTRRTLEVEAALKRQDNSVVAEASSVQFITHIEDSESNEAGHGNH